MNLQILNFPEAGFTKVYDVNMGLYYFIQSDTFATLDTTSLGASARLTSASEFVVHHSGEIKKMPMKSEQLVTAYMTQRVSGASVKYKIPDSVRNALVALNTAVALQG